jgi:serine/threonine protein kinase
MHRAMTDTPSTSHLDSRWAHEPLAPIDRAPFPTLRWEDRYVLGAVLGEGGMSHVYEAEDLLLARTVAIKALKAHSLPSRTMVTQEARALAAVEHPNVVRVHSVYPEASPPFLVMERVRGRALSSLLRNGRLPLPEALRIIRQIAAGLDALHAAGLVHGDVKPANVIVDTLGSARLIDVGLAPFVTRMPSDEILGTPAYMAPERALGAEIAREDHRRCDVYSLGVVAFELLTGQLPFTAPTPHAVLFCHAYEPAPLASECAPIAKLFDEPLASALAKDPQARPSTCAALADALSAASRGVDAHGRRLRVLVADDDHDQRVLLRAVLGVHLPGAEIVLCDSGPSALDALSLEHTSVAVLDLSMPGTSGVELVARVRERSPDTAVVIVTGGGSGIERKAARELGVRRFIVKPCEVDELVDAIREQLDAMAAHTALRARP